MVAHPSVTLLVDLSEAGGVVYDAPGRRERGSVVIERPARHDLAGGRPRSAAQLLQIRLEPVTAAGAARRVATELGARW